jgi:hypothetical protein
MKFSMRILKLGLLTCFFLTLWGCIEYTITTQVMPDGRLLRTITVKGDSASVFRGSFRVPSDTGWTISNRYEQQKGKDSVNGKVYVYEATREFPDFKAVNSCFYRDTSFSDHINIRVELTKKSRWFYTYYAYTETYLKLFPFRSVPISKYLSDTELRIYLASEEGIYYSPSKDSLMITADSMQVPLLTRTDSLRFKELRDSLDFKFESWQKVNIYNDLYKVICKALDNTGKSSDTVNARQPFYHWLDSTRVFDKVMENSDAFIREAAAFFRIDPSDMKAANREGFELFAKKFRVSALTLESYTNQVLMPGMILYANTHDKNGNLVAWHFKISSFYANDFIMTAQSRTVNKPAVVLASILLVMLIGLTLIRLFRK